MSGKYFVIRLRQTLVNQFMRNKFNLFVVSTLLSLTVCLHAQYYSIVDLGSLGGKSAIVNALNNKGQATGSAETLAGGYDVVLYSGTGTGNISLHKNTNFSFEDGNDINDFGVVVGYAKENDKYSAFIFTVNGNTEISGMSSATAINNSGIIVGYRDSGRAPAFYYNYDNYSSALRFDSNLQILTELGGLAGEKSMPRAVNENNQIIGECSYPYYNQYNNYGLRYYAGVLFSGSGTDNFDLGYLGKAAYSSSGSAYDINDFGQIVGIIDAKAALFSGSGLNNVELGVLPGDVSSLARAINNSSLIVGNSYASDREVQRAFIYRGGVMLDINRLVAPNSQVVFNEANDINDSGQIAVNGIYSSGPLKGFIRAFRLDPVTKPILISVKSKPNNKGSATITNYYSKNTFVELEATPNLGKKFMNWTEDGKIVSHRKKYRFKATKKRGLIANFM
jgi:probable HAF family extracellular repeat protein